MSNEKSQEIPAALPALSFVAGLLLAGSDWSPFSTAGGITLISVLVMILHRPATRRALMLLALAAGLTAGGLDLSRRAADIEFVTGRESRFVRVDAPLDGSWSRRSDGEWMLRTASFEVEEDSGERRHFRSPLLVFLSGASTPIRDEALLHAEGLLRPSPHGSFVLSVKSPILLSYRDSLPWWSPALWNRRAASGLDAYARAHPEAGRSVALAEALALGRSERLTDDLRETYRRGGIYHLLVFSGMQIAVAAAFLSMLLRLFGAPRVADVLLLFLSLAAPSFAGHQASVSRASWMLGLYSCSRLLRRPTPAANLLFVSAIIRLALVPSELTNAGFLLTYAATGGLLLIGPALATLFPKRKILAAFAAGLGAEIATTGLVLFFFKQYVIGSSIVTMVLSPLVTAMLALSAASAMTAIHFPLVAGLCLDALSRLDGLTSTSTAVIADDLRLFGFAPQPSLAILLFAWIASLILIAVTRSHRRRIGAVILLLLPVCHSAHLLFSRAAVRSPQLAVLDVGQGDSILLRTPAGAMLVDGGGRSGDEDFGRRVLVPILVERGVRTLDVLTPTHPDADHCGGLTGVLSALPVHEIWLSRRHLDSPCGERLLAIASERQIPALILPATSELLRIGARIEPLVPRLNFKRSPMNNSSVVYRITVSGTRILLTGDIQKEAEALLADEERSTLPADVLKVAHHGSRSSSTEAFIAAVHPRTAMISCGAGNPFGHPSRITLDKLREHHIHVYRTDREGTITLYLDQWPTGVALESRRVP